MTTFTSVFGDDTIPPADQSYRAVALTADVTLGFPSTTDGEDIVAAIMDVTASSGPFAITLPPATNASVGVDFLVNNVGASSFLIKDKHYCRRYMARVYLWYRYFWR
jgi:NAD(P)-dependent dehydrogenase (short-subunit alcohol dehydrogenase family)